MKYSVIAILTAAVGTFVWFTSFSTKEVHKVYRNEKVFKKAAPEDSIISIVAVGDMMLGSNFPDESFLPPLDVHLLKPVWSILQSADITFGNLEGTVLNKGGELKNCSDWSKCYAFRQPEYMLDQIKEAGFDLLSVANNHMGDFGNTGRSNTVRLLKEKGFKYAGLESCPWDTMTVKGVKIGFIAFAPNTGCLQITGYSAAKLLVEKLNKMCDVVIVSFHGGAEGSGKTHVTRKSEIFYDENRGNVYEFARLVIDAGADVVLGHGPHVTRAIDMYKGRFITYSMGNFCTYNRFNLNGVCGIAPIFELKITKKGVFVSGNVVSIKQVGEGGPMIDDSGGAFEQIKSLTSSDIPELKVDFSNSGSFIFK
jgi:hypothetical protein